MPQHPGQPCSQITTSHFIISSKWDSGFPGRQSCLGACRPRAGNVQPTRAASPVPTEDLARGVGESRCGPVINRPGLRGKSRRPIRGVAEVSAAAWPCCSASNCGPSSSRHRPPSATLRWFGFCSCCQSRGFRHAQAVHNNGIDTFFSHFVPTLLPRIFELFPLYGHQPTWSQEPAQRNPPPLHAAGETDRDTPTDHSLTHPADQHPTHVLD
ncbi:hypothetical protein BT67DRAFT_174041 [Trichocladium antarcticum]|uniref:Uncharacterized protein n=1 Tax=Trichocladium antarcticum TaxID=1450529 RepID=A0AAN6ZEN8_9PEZI|nr:hypothetical protein BT67DRAFT_174041 [Trichocladium antarcticum]